MVYSHKKINEKVKPIIINASYATLLTISLLSSSASQAEPNIIDLPAPPPAYIYDTPSTEMDFDLPPVPTISEAPELETGNYTYNRKEAEKDTTRIIDNFFSSTTINPDIMQKAEKEPDNSLDSFDDDIDAKENSNKKANKSKKTPVNKWWRKPKIKFVKNNKSINSFYNQVLPKTIYKRNYNRDNKHLPKAWYKHDMINAMVLATERGDIKTMRALVKTGISPNKYDYYGEPLLIHAVRFGALSSVKWLLVNGADTYAMSQDGVSAIHLAVHSGNKELVKSLLDHGADPNQLDIHGISPLTYAEKGQSPKLVHILYEYGAV